MQRDKTAEYQQRKVKPVYIKSKCWNNNVLDTVKC